jgi:hypothetical protein
LAGPAPHGRERQSQNVHLLDLSHLDQLAARLEAHGDSLVAARGDLVARAAATRWDSPAQRAFDAALRGLLRELQTGVDGARHGAQTLRSHHRRAADRAAELATLADVAGAGLAPVSHAARFAGRLLGA